jgi:hypothetical protein
MRVSVCVIKSMKFDIVDEQTGSSVLHRCGNPVPLGFGRANCDGILRLDAVLRRSLTAQLDFAILGQTNIACVVAKKNVEQHKNYEQPMQTLVP